MQATFRIECPKCLWGHEFKDSYINMGFLKGKCQHCGNEFFFKITVAGVNVEVSQELPEGVPCATLPEVEDAVEPVSEVIKICTCQYHKIGVVEDGIRKNNPMCPVHNKH
jgi:hypothetical protein